MKRHRYPKKLISLVMIVFVVIGSFTTACSFSDVLETFQGSAPDGSIVELSPHVIPLAQTPAAPIVLMPEAAGTKVDSNSKAIIDYSNSSDGYVMLKWLTQTSNQIRVQITRESNEAEVTYTYTIWPNGNFEVFPLSDGNGKYAINVWEQTQGDRYSLAHGTVINVTLKDEFAPFLRPNQFVNFDKDSGVVKRASEIVSRDYDLIKKVSVVYGFVIGYLSYDRDFANAVIRGEKKGYIPDLDEVLDRGKGICFDYASLMAAMLRSQGVPTKLVIGFAGEVRHAWINVYSEETGWIDRVVFFDGENWTLMDPTFASTASNAASLQQFIGDGSNYTVLTLH